MSSVIRQETAVFLYAVLHGALLTLTYDFLRALRRAFRHNLAVLSLEDFLFWLLAGALTFLLIYQRTDGTVRGYVIVGIFLGFFLCHLTLSPVFVSVCARLLTFAWRILCLPFHLLASIVRKLFMRTGYLLIAQPKKICRIFCEKSKKRIEFTRKKVYNGTKAFSERKRGRLKRGKENGSKDSKKSSRKEKAE